MNLELLLSTQDQIAVLAGTVSSFWGGLLNILFVLVCLMMIFLVLIQKGSDGGGLGTAFGGQSSADSLFGVKAAAGIKYFTAYVAIAFMILSLLIAKMSAGSKIVATNTNKVLPSSIQEDKPEASDKADIEEEKKTDSSEETTKNDATSSEETPPADASDNTDDGGN